MVTIKNLETGQVVQQVMTPAKVNLKRSSGYFEKARYEITFKKPGYKTHVRTIKGDLSAWYLAGNLLLGGVIGWLIVDPLTGAMYYLDEEVTVSLETATAEASSEQQLRVGTIKDLTPAQRSRLKPVPANGEKPRSASRAATRTQRR